MDFIEMLKNWKCDFKNEHYLKRLCNFLNHKKCNITEKVDKKHKHHIIPRSWNKDYINESDNIVILTPREHLFVHYLMVKSFPKNYQMAYTFQRLCNGKDIKDVLTKPSHLLALKKQNYTGVYSHPPEVIKKQKETRIKNGNNISAIKGKKCYNNGIIDKFFFEGDEEIGFVLGSVQRGIKKQYIRNELSELKVYIKNKYHALERYKNGWRNSITVKGEKNINFGSTLMHDPDTLKNIRIKRGEDIPKNLKKGYYYETEKWDERNKKISLSLTGKPHWWQDKINKNPIKIAKMAEKHRGMKRPQITKERLSAAKKRFYENGGQNPVKGLKCAYNIETLELKFLDPNKDLPENFVWGNSKTKKFWYVSPLGEKGKFNQKNAPNGWALCKEQ